MNTRTNHPISLQRDPVDELLKADAEAMRSAYIDDAGFTLRVMDTLPPRPKAARRLRAALPLLGALIAAVPVALFSPVGNFVIDATMDVLTQTPSNSAYALLALATAMICVAVAGLQGDR